MGTVIACVDGSAHADGVRALAAWAARRLGLPVTLLHVQAPHAGRASTGDLSGALGVEERGHLLEQLAALDEERGTLERRKGRLILEHAEAHLRGLGVGDIRVLHRRGSLAETLAELEEQAELIVVGKHGEHAGGDPAHLGANLERVAWTVRHPLLVSGRATATPARFLVAFAGGANSLKAVNYAATTPLLRGLEGHLLRAGAPSAEAEASLRRAAGRLSAAGIAAHTALQPDQHVEEAVAAYIAARDIDLLIIGAYGHSRLRSLILGSTTTALLRQTAIPVLLFH